MYSESLNHGIQFGFLTETHVLYLYHSYYCLEEEELDRLSGRFKAPLCNH